MAIIKLEIPKLFTAGWLSTGEGKWAVVLKCLIRLGFLYTVPTVNSHLPVALDNQPANLCNTHQGLWVSVQHSISECKHWLCYSLVECSGCHGNQFFPSLYNHLSIPVYTSILMAISLKPLGLYMPSAVDLTVCTTHAIAFWRTASVQGNRRQLYCTGNIPSLLLLKSAS